MGPGEEGVVGVDGGEEESRLLLEAVCVMCKGEILSMVLTGMGPVALKVEYRQKFVSCFMYLK